MAKQPATAEKETPEPPEPKTPTEKITNQIINKLGKPPHYSKTEVKRVGINTYRVNIYASTQHEFKDIAACMPLHRITDSYYTTTNDEGTITHTSPKLTKKYAIN